MTCIIGIEKDCVVYMGGDSMAASGWDARQTGLRKVFKNAQYLIGYSSSFRMGQLLQYKQLPSFSRGEWVRDKNRTLFFMVSAFVPYIRNLFTEAGYTKIENNREEAGSFLVGLDGFLFSVEADYQVQIYEEGYAAIGCGANYALGALACLSHLEPKEAIAHALEVAGHFSNGVRGPYYIEEVHQTDNSH